MDPPHLTQAHSHTPHMHTFTLDTYTPPHLTHAHPHTCHTEMRQALTKLIGFTTEPKSAEVRRQSQKVLTRLFDLNPATLTMMLNSLPRIQQDSANRILQGYVADMSSSGEESDREKPSPKRASPAQRKVRCSCTSCLRKNTHTHTSLAQCMIHVDTFEAALL